MKTKFLFILTFAVLLNAAWISPAAKPRSKDKAEIAKAGNFSYFRLHRQGRSGVASTWAVNSSQGISGFVLQKTYEYPDEYATWENIYEVGCGNGNSYGYVDPEVFPGNISYRVIAMNGTVVAFSSGISAIQIRQR
jgi:hypothetical protein